jgi:hypothetical protein
MSGKAFLVLGMHRSGTSAVARLLNLAGAPVFEQLIVPQRVGSYAESMSVDAARGVDAACASVTSRLAAH